MAIGYWANTYEFGASEPLARTENRRTDYEPECSKREDADLCAQMRMAKSAEDQASINELGLWLLGFTFVFTAVAAAATTASAIIASSTARRQLRAYIGVENHSVDKLAVGIHTCVKITITNFGQTPAYDVRNANDLLVAPIEQREFDTTKSSGGRVLNPGDKIIMSSLCDDVLSAADTEKFAGNTHRMFSVGVITYRDTFGKKHTYTYRFEYGADHSVSVRAFAISDHGNTAT
jgi:hypothetical protein